MILISENVSVLSVGLNIVKLMAKVSLPDSVQYRMIQVGGADVNAAKKTADSVYTALKGGADFEALSKKYGQTGEKIWTTSQQLVGMLAQSADMGFHSMGIL